MILNVWPNCVAELCCCIGEKKMLSQYCSYFKYIQNIFKLSWNDRRLKDWRSLEETSSENVKKYMLKQHHFLAVAETVYPQTQPID